MPVASRVAEVMAVAMRKAFNWVVTTTMFFTAVGVGSLAMSKLDYWLHSACEESGETSEAEEW